MRRLDIERGIADSSEDRNAGDRARQLMIFNPAKSVFSDRLLYSESLFHIVHMLLIYSKSWGLPLEEVGVEVLQPVLERRTVCPLRAAQGTGEDQISSDHRIDYEEL